MFELALKGKLPIIGVETDDILNVEVVLQSIAGVSVAHLPKTPSASGAVVWWTDKLDQITPSLYKRLIELEKQVVVLNLEKPHPLVFATGVLPTPQKLITDYLEHILEAQHIQAVAGALKGLSLKAASEVVQITMARSGGLNPQEVRKTRMNISGGAAGLQPVSVEAEFYVMPEDLEAWLDMNDEFFLKPGIPMELVPRGVMLDGPPGTGKTMAARAIARYWTLPLFHLDVATTLNKYIGESEGRISRSLDLLEREAPCVVLFDEVEKIFKGSDDTGTTNRILSQLLWWLSEHRAKIITVMTTNKLADIPPELYRPGRLDKVLRLKPLSLNDTKTFMSGVFKSVLKKPPTLAQQKTMRDRADHLWKPDSEKHYPTISHAMAADVTYDLIKTCKWLETA